MELFLPDSAANLVVSDQVGADEAVVEPLEFVPHRVVARLADNVLQASHHVVDALEREEGETIKEMTLVVCSQ